MLTKAPKGTKDVTPADSARWQHIEGVMRQVCALFGYKEARTPVFEHTELFLRSVGNTTDIVQKEMYTFNDKGGRSITLKPEGTAGIARMFVEHSLYNHPLPLKMYYLNSPVFRYENPQAGRLREHHQFGIEVFGATEPSCDAEIIWLAHEVLKRLGVGDLELNINSIGCPKCRPGYNQKLQEYFENSVEQLCGTCKERLDTNPLRILDCKVPTCRPVIDGAPSILECLCEECEQHFDGLKRSLTALGIDYKIDPMIVRGLDYYTKTVFEIISSGIGAQGTVCGGGRYDGLIEEIGGPSVPGVGFGMGMERLLMVMESAGLDMPRHPAPYVYVCTMKGTEENGLALVKALRDVGITAETNYAGRSIKSQFKFAGKSGCRFVATIGPDEAAADSAKLKDMDTGEESLIRLLELADIIKESLN
ncbi:MAG: histidine--tRNA ligase [Christensenellales bacterium]